MKVHKILQNSVIYSIVTVLQKGISFFLLPIYTLYLTPADYGVMGVSSSIASLISIFLTLGLGAAANRFYYSHNKDEVYAKKLFGTIVTMVIIISVVGGGIIILLHKWIINPFLGDIDFYPCILLGLLNIIITPAYLYFQEYLQTRQEGLHYGINSICFFVLHVCLTLFLLIKFDMGVVGAMLAQLINSFVFFIYAGIVFSKRITIGINKKIARESLKYSLPLLPHQIANWSNGAIDRLLINGMKSESDAGLYNLGQQYSSVMNIISNSVNQAYVPWFFEKINEGKRGLEQIVKMADAIIAVLSFFAIVMSLFAKEVLDLMVSNPAYDGIWKFIPLLIIGYLFHSVYFFFINVLYIKSKDTKLVFTVSIFAMIMSVVLNVLFIPIWGCMGSAIAFSATYLIQSIAALVLSLNRNKEIKLHWAKMYMVCFTALGMSMLPILLQNLSVINGLIIKLLVVAVLAVFIIAKYKERIRTFIKEK
ncbi:MAG: oligosaccharide flippase family protein [Bacteroidales bacterium]|nr:oligosaccharide flippase family protein [Bacteroidales bacterium]